ncbi:MAG: alanine--glyoxylate aminotransferase family protein [Planctomycetaceae bacterium]|jgi:aspartate aminotransferase-like enzyme|nr:alanine--glyoxylate aminotransferase family protein [Planctomycetaceae bacterium]
MKRRLFTPGPTQVPEESLLTLARQVTHHRTLDFENLFVGLVTGLRKICISATADILFLAGSGTAAMEAAVVNSVARGGRALCLVSGKFSERWVELCNVYGITPVVYEVEWGEPFDANAVRKFISDGIACGEPINAVFTTLCETSTGLSQDIEHISKAIDDAIATASSITAVTSTPERPLLIVDGISAVGAVPCRMDDWKIDLLCIGAQKALMGHAGVAIVAVSQTAWQRIELVPRQTFYLDLLKYRKNAAKNTTPFTPPKPLLEALLVNVRSLVEYGIENVWQRTSNLATATRNGFETAGLQIFPKQPSDAMTVCLTPETIDYKRFMTIVEQKYGIKFAGGQGMLKGKIFRMAHFGIIDEFDIIGVIGAVELTLHELGYNVLVGTGVAAAMKTLATVPNS